MDPILVGKAVTTEDSGKVWLLPQYANRHGLVAGATGTGKTVTLMTLAEGFSRLGVPVFMADVKGDIAGLALAGTPSSEKCPASICSVTVLPVPVAPVTRPCRFASAGRKRTSRPSPVRAMTNGSLTWQSPDDPSAAAQTRALCPLPRA